jgi:DNA primase
MTRDLADFKARLPVVEIVRRYVRLVRNGPLHKGLCPFHNEKTPSFTVTESRGTYHCFGCGAHGNALDFLMAIEGLDFAEAIRRAGELTGVEPPAGGAPDPRSDRRRALSELLEEANRRFRARLAADDGAPVRAYLQRRGLGPETIARFELGYAGGGRSSLSDALAATGAARDDLVEAGLAIAPDDGGAPYDRFRERLTFAIRDGRGRLVGFGGRALADGAKAKYLNSPEGPLFHKRELLYGAHGLDRRAGRGRIHVVEGYMDVIALAQHGLAAVAPLGTAMTEAQLERLWRLDDAPLVCLDGDEAGRHAAGRLAERALAVLVPGRSLAFALLPPGEDPDSLVRTGGAEAFARATTAPVPLVEMLWRHVAAGLVDGGPEARAQLRRRLRALVRGIRDPDLRREYGREFRRRLGGDDRADGGARASTWRAGRPDQGRVRRNEPADTNELLVPLVLTPRLLERFDERIAELRFETPEFERFKNFLLDRALGDDELTSAELQRLAEEAGLAATLASLRRWPAWRAEMQLSEAEREDAYVRKLEAHETHRAKRVERARSQASAAGGDELERVFRALNGVLNRSRSEP